MLLPLFALIILLVLLLLLRGPREACTHTHVYSMRLTPIHIRLLVELGTYVAVSGVRRSLCSLVFKERIENRRGLRVLNRVAEKVRSRVRERNESAEHLEVELTSEKTNDILPFPSNPFQGPD